MSDLILASTRKGLFSIRRGPGGWAVAGAAIAKRLETSMAAEPRSRLRVIKCMNSPLEMTSHGAKP